METVFYCHANQTHSYMKGFAPGFVSKVKVFQLGNDLLYRHFKTPLCTKNLFNTVRCFFSYIG